MSDKPMNKETEAWHKMYEDWESEKADHALTHSDGSLRLQCHRCGWEGVESELDVNEYGEACPKCPQFRDVHASLSIIENTEN